VDLRLLPEFADNQGMQVIGTMVVIALGAPIVLLVFIPLGFVYRLVMRYYLSTSRELKRLDAVSRSPIFSFFGETLSGLAVIRVCHLPLFPFDIANGLGIRAVETIYRQYRNSN
jgi:ABC-type multidrug transport system fused ATPase/permease subunit